jgi:hypothetical protein
MGIEDKIDEMAKKLGQEKKPKKTRPVSIESSNINMKYSLGISQEQLDSIGKTDQRLLKPVPMSKDEKELAAQMDEIIKTTGVRFYRPGERGLHVFDEYGRDSVEVKLEYEGIGSEVVSTCGDDCVKVKGRYYEILFHDHYIKEIRNKLKKWALVGTAMECCNAVIMENEEIDFNVTAIKGNKPYSVEYIASADLTFLRRRRPDIDPDSLPPDPDLPPLPSQTIYRISTSENNLPPLP